MREALNDLRIIDVTQALAGPYSTMVLADMGAEVIKVENPEGGDRGRHASGRFHIDDTAHYFGGLFNSVNRNKKSVAVDLKSPEGVAIIRELAETADVFVENFRTGVVERLGVDYESLRDSNPRLVYSSLSGFGNPRTGKSPYAGKPCTDNVAQAMGGAQYITSPEPNGMPTRVGPGIGDIVPGMFNTIGILTALWEREKSGRGQYVDVSMYDSIVALCERMVYLYSYKNEVHGRVGNRQPTGNMPNGVFEAKDGYVSLNASGHYWETFCEHMDRMDLYDDPRFETDADRDENYEELKTEIEEWTTQHTRKELFELLSDDLPCGPVNSAAEIFDDPHTTAREMLRDVEQPLGDGKSTKVAVANTPIKLTETPGGVERRGPFLGEHNDEILSGLGYSPDEISSLYDRRIINRHSD